ncbi:hypothetical protein DXG01_002177 [Tephrocybe rancida]|nr:hypothetical protein DXG01_002177 [Tephrocybe rancida]
MASTRDDIHERLKHDLDLRISNSSPTRDIFEKTAALIATYRQLGCTALQHEKTLLTESEQLHQRESEKRHFKMSRGYLSLSQTKMCEGRLLLQYSDEEQPYILCEHYERSSRDHYIQYLDGSYDVDYLEAYFNEDNEEMDRIEEGALGLGYGPLADCTNIANSSSQRTHCPVEHRDSDGNLYPPELLKLTCKVKVRYYEPLPEYRSACPYTLVTLKGVHHHPIPLPHKTPPIIRKEVHGVLRSISEDLPDLTTRRFLRHPVLKSYLSSRFPDILLPTLMDLHVSLGNRSHVQFYITTVKEESYPDGTGWDEVPPQDGDNNEDERTDPTQPLRIVICMTRAASHRLLKAQYLQCDIGFKRVVGFQEFELAGMDRTSNSSITYCRVFVTRQTAAAHLRVFQEIDRIVLQDTGTMPMNLIVSYPNSPHMTTSIIFCASVLYTSSGIFESAPSPTILVCITHDDWEGTIKLIEEKGGKAGTDWVQDKIRSGFAFEAMCWQKSKVPLEIWWAGDATSNVVESVHSDVNREGIHCTLVGGVRKGQHFDKMRMSTLEATESTGTRASYLSGHPSENVARGMKRKFKNQHQRLVDEDNKLEVFNKKMKQAKDKSTKHAESLHNKQDLYRKGGATQADVDKAQAAHEKAKTAYEKLAGTAGAMPKGSGRIKADGREIESGGAVS